MAPAHLPLRLPLRPLPRHTPILPSTPSRHLHARVAPQAVPNPTPFVPDATTFLTLIGRSLSTHAAKIPSWPALFTLTSPQLRDLGVEPARARRYLLAWRDRFRRGEFGPGGDCAFVDAQGRAQLRLVDVRVGSALERRAWWGKHGREGHDAVVDSRGRGDGASEEGWAAPATVSHAEGFRKIVVNVPTDLAVSPGTAAEANEGDAGADAMEALDEGVVETQTLRDLTPDELDRTSPVLGVGVKGARELVGRHVQPVKGTKGMVATIQVKEGLWEHRRGHKIDGGERRKAEVRAKRGAAERKAARR